MAKKLLKIKNPIAPTKNAGGIYNHHTDSTIDVLYVSDIYTSTYVETNNKVVAKDFANHDSLGLSDSNFGTSVPGGIIFTLDDLLMRAKNTDSGRNRVVEIQDSTSTNVDLTVDLLRTEFGYKYIVLTTPNALVFDLSEKNINAFNNWKLTNTLTIDSCIEAGFLVKPYKAFKNYDRIVVWIPKIEPYTGTLPEGDSELTGTVYNIEVPSATRNVFERNPNKMTPVYMYNFKNYNLNIDEIEQDISIDVRYHFLIKKTGTVNNYYTTLVVKDELGWSNNSNQLLSEIYGCVQQTKIDEPTLIKYGRYKNYIAASDNFMPEYSLIGSFNSDFNTEADFYLDSPLLDREGSTYSYYNVQNVYMTSSFTYLCKLNQYLYECNLTKRLDGRRTIYKWTNTQVRRCLTDVKIKQGDYAKQTVIVNSNGDEVIKHPKLTVLDI